MDGRPAQLVRMAFPRSAQVVGAEVVAPHLADASAPSSTTKQTRPFLTPETGSRNRGRPRRSGGGVDDGSPARGRWPFSRRSPAPRGCEACCFRPTAYTAVGEEVYRPGPSSARLSGLTTTVTPSRAEGGQLEATGSFPGAGRHDDEGVAARRGAEVTTSGWPGRNTGGKAEVFTGSASGRSPAGAGRAVGSIRPSPRVDSGRAAGLAPRFARSGRAGPPGAIAAQLAALRHSVGRSKYCQPNPRRFKPALVARG